MKSELNMETVRGTDGLHLEQTENGIWQVKQTSRQTVLVECQTKERAKEAAEKLGRLTGWNTSIDRLNYVKYNNPATYEQIMNLRKAYEAPYKERASSPSAEKASAPELKKQSITFESIKRALKQLDNMDGYGFLIQQESATHIWKIIHASSNIVVGWTDNEGSARHAVQELERYVSQEIMGIEKAVGKIEQYVKDVEAASKAQEELPTVPDLLAFQLVFAQIPAMRERWPVFEEAWLELESMIGLTKLKAQIRSLVWQMKGRMRANRIENEHRKSLHMVFAGEPGTGKTQVAEIIVRLVYAVGAMDKPQLVTARASDLLGSVLGETENKTADLLKRAMGGGLLIDEAYALAAEEGSNDFGKKAVNMLVEAMDRERKNFFLILAGYPQEMKDLIKMNRGLPSRIRHYLSFESYTPQELDKIGKKMLEAEGLRWGKEEDRAIKTAIENRLISGILPGNGRDVRNIVDNMIEEYYARIGADVNAPVSMLTIRDILKATQGTGPQHEQEGLEAIREKALAELRALTGMKQVKQQAEKWISRTALEQEKFIRGLVSEKPRLHMVFEGPSGTGKSTVAEIIGRFLKGTGLLSTGTFQKVTRADLVGRWQGTTAREVRRIVEESLGGVLLIDEAYSLITGETDSFGKEALTELVELMGVHQQNLSVIFAGYSEDIKKLMMRNQGLPSRIAQRFVFTNYTVEDMQMIVYRKMMQNGLILSKEDVWWMTEVLKEVANKNQGTFLGNGHWANNWLSAIKDAQAGRIAQQNLKELSNEALLTVIKEDMENALSVMP